MPTNTTSENDVMPHPTLTKIFDKPTQPTLTLMHSEILANAMDVPSDGGDGQLGHARLVLSANAYDTASHGHVAYITPVKPSRVYNIDLAAWKLRHDTEKKLLQQLLAEVENIFTTALKTTFGATPEPPPSLSSPILPAPMAKSHQRT
jgi:hypothetical protein